MRSWAVGMVVLAAPVVPGGAAAAQEEETPATPTVTWDAEGLSRLPAMLAKAGSAGKRLLVGLSGGDG